MKVNLTALVFSSNVADVSQYCNENLKPPHFQVQRQTVMFCMHVDSAFNILNCWNPLAQSKKVPIQKENTDEMVKIL